MSVTDSGSTLLCAECQQRRVTAVASLQSRHAAPVEMNSGQHRFRLFAQTPPSWLVAGVLGLVAAALYSTMGLPNLAVVLLAQAFRIGPLQELLRNLPEIHSLADFENRHYRVQQSLWLVSLCSGIYTLIPEETLEAANQGWKINLVTMETSMASGIAATYGYSVAGGVPGGLLAEYVMPLVGKPTVAEVTPFVGPGAAKAITSCGLFMVMGSYMECVTIIAYAFAHQADTVPKDLATPSETLHGGAGAIPGNHGRTSEGIAVGSRSSSPWPSPNGPTAVHRRSGSTGSSRDGNPRGTSLCEHGVSLLGSATSTARESSQALHQARPSPSDRDMAMPDLSLPPAGQAAPDSRRMGMAAMVRALPDFSHLLPDEYRRAYSAWRHGDFKGAKGEPSSQGAGQGSTAANALRKEHRE